MARRVCAWAVWWVLLMSFWVMLDDSTATDELLAGAGAAALGAFLAELVAHQAGLAFRMRAGWLVSALRLPGQVARDTVIVFHGPVAAAGPRRGAGQRVPRASGAPRRRQP